MWWREGEKGGVGWVMRVVWRRGGVRVKMRKDGRVGKVVSVYICEYTFTHEYSSYLI